ncbi:hypothetical protein BC351_00750 [Paenibacillus ferrarius]|uniref:Uncharacterized protein n=1 Tax=Paenibacillus ferrarius TaxID=1469647 RepID=A0A1V4HSJ6_9BACL|nr:DNA sulfur modification protein DndB [Paenibacillus ferrarius]OPH61802.1 hypothetical protein BC351_00750 [Paenibacillus ferrarius]
MFRDRIELENELIEVLNKIKHNRKDISKIDEKLFVNNRVALGTISDLTKGGLQELNKIDETLLCIVANAVCDVSGEIRISPINYYTPEEIDYALNNEYFNGETSEILPITLENVLMAKTDEYITVIKITDLVHWKNEGLIIYDYESQRSAKYVRKQNGVIPTPDLNKQHVKEISEHQLNGTYIVDTITLNIYSDEITALNYNNKTKTLKINKGARISITDGFHRLEASVLTVKNDPETEEVFQVAIKSFDTDKAQKTFGQYNTYHPVSKERVQSLKKEKFGDYVVEKLKYKSDLKGKVSTEKRLSTLANHLTTTSILSEAIDHQFKMESQKDVIEVSEYLEKFFNYLIGSFKDEFVLNQNKYRETSFINNQYVFAGYVVLARRFRDENIPIIKLEEVIKNINFSKEVSDFSGLFSKGKKSIPFIISYFESLNLKEYAHN